MAGYLSLFYDDSSSKLPSQSLEQAKNEIFKNYQKVFRKPNPKDKRDLQDQITNQILTEMSAYLQQGNLEGEAEKSDVVKYWDISLGAAIGIVDRETSILGKVSAAIKETERIQNTLSNAISACNGKISQNLIDQMHQDRQILGGIAKRFDAGMSEDSFKGAFFGSLAGAIKKAQGSIHEAAAALAAAGAKEKIEKELIKANQQYRLIVEATGGKLTEDSALRGREGLGKVNNAKNDLTIAMTDGNGQIVWSTGISLKSTSSSTPQTVRIMQVSLSTLLNKIYDEQTYINLAGALGKGDWAGSRKGIAALAQQKEITTSGAELAERWKEAVYRAIYLQVVDMFSGSGGILNNAQYLIINATPISMYEIFSKLQSIQNPNSLESIQGLNLGGKMSAINRADLVKKNVAAFRRGDPAVSRVERSSQAWSDIYNILTQKKITISLNYASLFGTATR